MPPPAPSPFIASAIRLMRAHAAEACAAGRLCPESGGGPAVLSGQFHAGLLLGLSAPAFGGGGIRGNHGALQRCAKLARRLLSGPDQNLPLDRPGQVVVERGRPRVDELGPPEVDRPLAQRGPRPGQPAGQADRQAHPPLSGKLRQGQGQCDLVRGELRLQLPDGVTVQFGIIHDTPAAPELGDRG